MMWVDAPIWVALTEGGGRVEKRLLATRVARIPAFARVNRLCDPGLCHMAPGVCGRGRG